MKQMLILLLLLTALNGFAQECISPPVIATTRNPAGYIEPRRAQARIDRYQLMKNQRSAPFRQSVSFRPCGMLDLLKKVTDKAKDYSGLRVYFAAYPDNKDSVILIFAPTKHKMINGYNIHRDDDTAYYVIDGDLAILLPMERAKKYVAAFKGNQRTHFFAEGVTRYRNEFFDQDFDETVAIWYSIEMLKPGVNGTNLSVGLITYLQDLINNNQVDNITAYFAGYEHIPRIDYYHQLTVIFRFSKGDTVKTNFSGRKMDDPAMRDKNRPQGITKMKPPINKPPVKNRPKNANDVDTGVPCPPPPPTLNCTDAGALLEG
jgi:hypothetical protein